MPSNPSKIIIVKLLLAFLLILLVPALLFFLANDWQWVEGWIFSVWFIIICFAVIVYLYYKSPKLFTEPLKIPRGDTHAKLDVYVLISLFIGFTSMIIIMPLDAKRYEWTIYFPVWARFIGLAELCLSFFFFFGAYKEKMSLYALVRMQKESPDKIITSGVYGFVRHPMYLGGIFLFIGAPMLLGSAYGIIIGLLMLFLLILRIYGEEQILEDELEGYDLYKTKVKYRLLPWIW